MSWSRRSYTPFSVDLLAVFPVSLAVILNVRCRYIRVERGSGPRCPGCPSLAWRVWMTGFGGRLSSGGVAGLWLTGVLQMSLRMSKPLVTWPKIVYGYRPPIRTTRPSGIRDEELRVARAVAAIGHGHRPGLPLKCQPGRLYSSLIGPRLLPLWPLSVGEPVWRQNRLEDAEEVLVRCRSRPPPGFRYGRRCLAHLAVQQDPDGAAEGVLPRAR